MISLVNRIIRFKGQYYTLKIGEEVGELPEALKQNLIGAKLVEVKNQPEKVVLMEEPAKREKKTKKDDGKEFEKGGLV